MDITYGIVGNSAPEGFLPRRVHFHQLVELDTPTKEGILARTILSSGFSSRTLPLSVGYMDQTLHSDFATAPVVGRLDQVRVNADKRVEGWAWIADTPKGKEAYSALATQMVRGNSIDMADVKYTVKLNWGDEDGEDFSVDAIFTESKIAATTICPIPAFGGAGGSLESDELLASLAIEGDLEVDVPWVMNTVVELPTMTAAAYLMEHDAFTVPEPDHYQPWSVSDDGRYVTGHLGSWEDCHNGFQDRCTRIPPSRTNYGIYCSSPYPTDKGRVWTGPVLLLEGHEATRAAINKAMESMENVWANIVVVDGKYGPWCCGMVSPSITPEALHAARGGRVSGHWLDGELHAIATVPVPGFSNKRVVEYAVETNDEGEVVSLVASFAMDCGCDEAETVEDRLARLEEAVFDVTKPAGDPEFAALQVLVALATGDDDDDDNEEGSHAA